MHRRLLCRQILHFTGAMAEPSADFQTLGRVSGTRGHAAVKNIGIVPRLQLPLILIKINGGTQMSDRKPVVVAVTVGGLALAANGAAAVIAISANSPPEAAAFGIIGLVAAFTGLVTTILWAWREDAVKPQPRRERVFTPWVPLAEEFEPRLVAARGASPLARAAMPAPAPLATPVPAVSGTVIYLQDWLKTRAAQHANA
jgi:hypothetical protein